MVYAIDAESTFDSMPDLLETARNLKEDSLFFLIGNKKDLDKQNKR